MRACLDGLSTVQHPGHHVTLNQAMRNDLALWLEAAAAHNGRLSLAPTLPTYFVYTDTCLSPVPSVGVFFDGAFVSLALRSLGALGLPALGSLDDINSWECFAILVAVSLFSSWRGGRVVFCASSPSPPSSLCACWECCRLVVPAR